MGYIVHKGSVSHSEDFDLIEAYAAAHKTKIISVELWSFESSSLVQVTVRWKNGAIGNFVAGDFQGTRAYIESLDGWPKPIVYSRSLPRSAGLMYLSATENNPAKAEEPEHATKRVVRQRHSEVVHRRRTRTQHPL